MSGKKALSRFTQILGGICLALLMFTQPAGAVKFISFGTGSSAGTYYFIGAGFASLINNNVPEVRVAAESTAASNENVRLMIRGEMEMGLACMGTIVSVKKQGLDVDKLKLVAIGHTSDVHWLVRKESDIQSIADFKGKVVGVGPAGSATLNVVSKQHLSSAWGLTFDDFSPKYISFTEVTRGLRDKTIDAGLIFAGAPLASVMELARDIPIRILDISPEKLAELRGKFSNVVPLTIPAGTYNGVENDIHTYCLPQMWLCRTDLSEEMVYKMIKAVYDHPEDRDAIHPMAKKFTPENAFRGSPGVPIGYHPGAIKYYKEIGIWDKRAEHYE